MVLGIRQRIVEDTDGSTSQIDDEDEDLTDEQIKAKAVSKGESSSEAANKFTDYSEHCCFRSKHLSRILILSL